MLCNLRLVISFPAPVAYIRRHIVNNKEPFPNTIVFTNPPAAKSPKLAEITPLAFHVLPLLDFVHRDHDDPLTRI